MAVKRKYKDLLKQLVPGFTIGLYHRLRLARVDYQFAQHRKKFAGEGFNCNFCGKSAVRFVPDGDDFEVLKRYRVVSAGRRPNSLCPHCRSKDRERLILRFLQDQTTLFSTPHRLLHIAPEAMLKTVFKAASNIDYINADLDVKLADVQMDITAIPMEDGHLDALICNHVLEHIPDDGLAMREIFRVLKPGGWAVLQVPIALDLKKTYEDFSVTRPADREVHFGQFDHVRIYGQDYTDRLIAAGFQSEVHDPLELFGQELLDNYAMVPEEKIYLVRKPVS